MTTSFVLAVISLVVVNSLRSNILTRTNIIRQEKRSEIVSRRCIDQEVSKVPQPDGDIRFDSDPLWRTPATTVVPFHQEPFSVRPEVITFDAFTTLIEPSQSVGRWLREVLNTVCDMRIRLPRPLFFTESFKKAYAEMSETYPCFGSQANMSSRDWWMKTIEKTYKGVELLQDIEPQEMDMLLPRVFQVLFDEVLSTKEGWQLKEDTVYTLRKLREWRDQGAGPKLGVIGNYDDRASLILAELGIADNFDFILDSYTCKSALPDTGMFDEALRRSGCSNPAAAYHVGLSVDTDVAGAIKAGWTGMIFSEWPDEKFPDWTAADTSPEDAEAGAVQNDALMQWGRRDLATNLEWTEIWSIDDVLRLFGFPTDMTKPIRTTYIRNYLDDF